MKNFPGVRGSLWKIEFLIDHYVGIFRNREKGLEWIHYFPLPIPYAYHNTVTERPIRELYNNKEFRVPSSGEQIISYLLALSKY